MATWSRNSQSQKGEVSIVAKSKILLVDDEMSVRRPYSEFLRDEGFLVDEADSLQAAVRLSNDKTYHIALVDVILSRTDPGNRDGLRVLQHIGSLGEGTVCIVVSQQEDPQLAADVVPEYGALRYLSKTKIRRESLAVLRDAAVQAAQKCTLHPFGLAED